MPLESESNIKKLMITIPIISRIYEEDGEIKFEVAGEKRRTS